MGSILKAVREIALHRPALAWLAAVDFIGAIYGFYWYWGQLMETPFYLWVLVADSPLSALLFGIVLLLYLKGVRHEALEAVAYFSMIKYGLWTVFVIGQFVLGPGKLDFENTHLFLSHAGMALEALIFWQYMAPSRKYILLAFLWAFANDCADYLGGLHPTLPHPPYLPWVAGAAFVLTVLTAAKLGATSTHEPRRILAWGATPGD